MSTNDNDTAGANGAFPPTDAHGRAALLLVESLIYGLCDNATLTIGDAIEIAERAVVVQREQAEAADDAAPMWKSHTMLQAITASLRIDDRGGPPTPPRLVT